MSEVEILRDRLRRALKATTFDSEPVQELIKTLITYNKDNLAEIAKTRPLLGAHTSIAGGYFKALEDGKSIGADVVAMFVASPRNWGIPALLTSSYERWMLTRALTGVEPGNAHGSYLLNLATLNEDLARKTQEQMIMEIQRCSELEIPLYTMHPGSRSLEEDMEDALARVSERLIPVLEASGAKTTTLCLETTAGSRMRSKIGDEFWHLGSIIRNLPKKLRNRIGVTVDTCHIWAAGYDIATEEGYQETMKALGQEVGFKYVKAFHLNGCRSELGQMVDRHAPIGDPPLDITPFRLLMNDERFKGTIMTLETPNPSEWPMEISMLLGLSGWDSPIGLEGTVSGQEENNKKYTINYGKRPYVVHNVNRPFIKWPVGFWVE